MAENTQAKAQMQRHPLAVFLLVLLCSYLNLAQAEDATDFSMLPALQQLDPLSKVLLDITRVPLPDKRPRLVAVGEQGIILYRDNQSGGWQQAEVPVSVTLTAVFFVSPDLGWAVGHQGIILHSSDGGRSWQQQFSGKEAHRQIISLLSDEKHTLSGRLQASSDPLAKEELAQQIEDLDFVIGDSTKAIKAGPSEPFLDVWFADSQFGIAAGAYGFLFVTHDGGRHWQLDNSYINNVDKFHFYAIAEHADGDIFICGEAGTLWRSRDRAQSWQPIDLPYKGSFFGIDMLPGPERQDSLHGGEEKIFVYGLRGNVFVSNDGGETWSRTEMPDDSSLLGGATTNSGDIVLVGASGVMQLSRDYGRSFTRIALPSKDTLADAIFLNRQSLLIVGKHGLVAWDFGESDQR